MIISLGRGIHALSIAIIPITPLYPRAEIHVVTHAAICLNISSKKVNPPGYISIMTGITIGRLWVRL